VGKEKGESRSIREILLGGSKKFNSFAFWDGPGKGDSRGKAGKKLHRGLREETLHSAKSSWALKIDFGRARKNT